MAYIVPFFKESVNGRLFLLERLLILRRKKRLVIETARRLQGDKNETSLKRRDCDADV